MLYFTRTSLAASASTYPGILSPENGTGFALYITAA